MVSNELLFCLGNIKEGDEIKEAILNIKPNSVGWDFILIQMIRQYVNIVYDPGRFLV